MAVYLRPEDAWGLSVWRSEPSLEMLQRSLSVYDNFYSSMENLLTRFIEKFGAVVLYDLHSYNHRRLGPDGPEADPAGNPDVNIGTGMLDKARWGSLVDQFKNDLREYSVCDRGLDVRENVKFKGGHFSRWCQSTFNGDVCVLAIEWKKIFMDEWTGEIYPGALASMRKALQGTVPGMLRELERLGEMKSTENPKAIQESLIRTLRERLLENKRIRRILPEGGRLHIDRQLPFLCVYRTPPAKPDYRTSRLIVGQASYLLASGSKHQRRSVAGLVRMIVQTLAPEFGTFLVLELWSRASEQGGAVNPSGQQPPEFRLVMPRGRVPQSLVDSCRLPLEGIKIRRMPAIVDLVRSGRVAPDHCSPLLTPAEQREFNCHVIGLEVNPIYFNRETGDEFPLIRRALQRELTRSLQQIFFSYMRSQTTQKPRHYLALGRRAVVKAVWNADRQLSEISEEYDFLLQATPVNIEAAWMKFKRQRFQRLPEFFIVLNPWIPHCSSRNSGRSPLTGLRIRLSHSFSAKNRMKWIPSCP